MNAEINPKIRFNDERRAEAWVTVFTYPASFLPRGMFVTSLTLLQQSVQRRNPCMKLFHSGNEIRCFEHVQFVYACTLYDLPRW